MNSPSDDRISQLRNLLDSDPTDSFCMYGIAMEYSKTGQHVEAIAWFDRTMETDPTYTYAWYHKARCQHESGANKQAEQTLQEGIDQAKSLQDTHALEEMSALLQSIQQ